MLYYSMFRKFLYFNHLKEVNETYFQHMKNSFSYSILFFNTSLKLIIHGILPNFYTTAGTDTANKVINSINNRKNF